MEERDYESAILALADAIQQLCEKIAAIDEEVDKMAKGRIYERLEGIESEFGSMVDGFNGILGDRRKGRYRDMITGNQDLMAFGPKYGKAFKSDIVEDVLNELVKYMEQEGASEEQFPALFESLLSDLRSRFEEEKAEGEGLEHEAMEGPAEEMAEHSPAKAIEVEVKSGPVEGDELDEMRKMARRFKGVRAG